MNDINNKKRNLYSIIAMIACFFLFVLLPILSSFQEKALIILGVLLFLLLIIYLSVYIKNIVVKVGRAFLDFFTTLDVVVSIVIMVLGFFICKDDYNSISNGVWWYIVAGLVYCFVMLLKDYALYLLIDIRDSLKILAENAESNKEDKKG